ncbi:hypothetical protein Y1Q_0024352 [Alligator mississippiensis]|uniref:Uncharacterized protein n=1 Tax=Alligator mississippiensis TaxID=8496 RepID=A0A151NIQ5_ALLMI|nr:hypothetical protein Y1Q_0024352 [Alligator mississippiensis]
MMRAVPFTATTFEGRKEDWRQSWTYNKHHLQPFVNYDSFKVPTGVQCRKVETNCLYLYEEHHNPTPNSGEAKTIQQSRAHTSLGREDA